MSRPVRHADLVARALGALPSAERDRVDAALAADPALRRRFEDVAGHLLQYEQLPPPPPPPPFERLAAALDDDAAPDLHVLRLQREGPTPTRRRPLGRLALAAAAVLVGVLLWRPWEAREGGRGLHLVPGKGMELVRAGVALPAPSHARVAVEPGDVLGCAQAAEARLGERVRLVLDGGARLRIEDRDTVTLERGRAWFEVAPGAFEVRTAYGPVRVVGTAFEVDLRAGSLEVAVAHGVVVAAGHEVTAEERLFHGLVSLDALGAGAWFGRPALRLERVVASSLRPGGALALRLVFHNAGNVALALPGPAGARTALWIRFEAADGRVLGELPVLDANVTAGREVLRPGTQLHLAPGWQHALTLKILPPFGSQGAYRCRALYRPAGQPGILSTTLAVEVR